MRDAKEAIYAELGRLYFVVKNCAGDDNPFWLKGHLQSNAFDYYYTNKREIFYLIPEYQELIWHFTMIKNLRTALEQSKKTPLEVTEVLNHAFNSRIQDKILNINKLQKYEEKSRQKLQHALDKAIKQGVVDPNQ